MVGVRGRNQRRKRPTVANGLDCPAHPPLLAGRDMWQPPPGFPFNNAAPPWAGGGATASMGGATAAAGPGGAFAAGPAFGGSAAWMGGNTAMAGSMAG
jgi:hypothetical protein